MRSGYVEALAGTSQAFGPWGRLEAGLHPWENVGLFGAGTWDQRFGFGAEVGAKWTFDF